jgi:hypothetical protein
MLLAQADLLVDRHFANIGADARAAAADFALADAQLLLDDRDMLLGDGGGALAGRAAKD